MARAAAQAADKREKCRISKLKSDAAKVCGKIASVLVPLTEVVARKAIFAKFPEVLQAKVTAVKKKLEAMEKEAHQKIKESAPEDLTFDMEQVANITKDVRSNHRNDNDR